MVVAYLGCTAPAAAAGRMGVSLSLSAEPALVECADQSSFEAGVTRRLGYDPFQEPPRHAVVVRSEHRGGELVGTVVWSSPQGRAEGERSFRAPDGNCAELIDQMAFAVAVQLQLLDNQEDAISDVPPPQTEQAQVPLRPPVRIDSHPAPPPAEPPRSAVSWHGMVGAGPGLGLGLLPAPSGFAGFYAALGTASTDLALGAEFSLPQTWRDHDGSGFRSNLTLVSLVPCYRTSPLLLCAVGRAGSLTVHGSGVDLPHDRSDVALWAGARAGIALSLASWLELRLHADALGAVRRYSVTLRGDAVWRTPPAAVTIGSYLGCSIR
jgi:hypothetical protein